ncbi:hypothetical protein ABE67_06025 [Cytobacillus firmus]|nr:hypothetical protein [Cytobacillus firmus]MBG9448883.1 hypothetical protein [Cytobacillus firmus]
MQISTFFGESLLVLSCMEETFREDRIYVGTKQIFTVSFIVFMADGKGKKKSGGFLNAGKNGRKR